VIKKWKRKEKQISYVWGLVRPDGESSLDLKPDHRGVSYFSWTRGTDAKKELKKDNKRFWESLSWIRNILLVAASVICFIVFNMYVENTIVQGFLLQTSSSLIDHFYLKWTKKSLEKENFKYLQEYKS
jgi:hypothetical protein